MNPEFKHLEAADLDDLSAAERKEVPIFSGVLMYFPDAIAAVAHLSKVGNDQHNPGQPLHWAREKSTDQHDCLIRHAMKAGTRDKDGQRHSAKVAWRALAALQLEIEADRAKQAEPYLLGCTCAGCAPETERRVRETAGPSPAFIEALDRVVAGPTPKSDAFGQCLCGDCQYAYRKQAERLQREAVEG